MPEFLKTLVSAGWIRRGAEPGESRFWRLLTDESAPMFGVFDGYEKQLISDWIVDAAQDGNAAGGPRRPNVNRFRRRSAAGPAAATAASEASGFAQAGPLDAGQVIRRELADLSAADRDDNDVRAVAARLACVEETAVAIDALQGFLSPANHASPAGLLATRICSGLIAR